MQAKSKLRALKACGVYLGVLLLTAILYFLFKPLLLVQRKGTIAQAFIVLGLSGCLLFATYMGRGKPYRTQTYLLLLLAAGYLLRVGYALYSPASTRQHDVFSPNYDGHEAYAWRVFSTGKLPSSNVYQFYHPPLNALVQAGFMRLLSPLCGLSEGFMNAYAYGMPDYFEETKRYFLFSGCQILSVFYAFCTMTVLVKTVRLFGFSEKTTLLLTAFVVFYPRQIQFAGALNNDPLAYLFASLALYFALKWQKGNKELGWILLCGLCVGLGMMSKLSSATVCLPIAGLFVYEGVRSVRKKEGALCMGRLALQYGLFLLVCAPLGLWFQIYARVRFGQPFGFVFSNLNGKLYTGERSFFARFFFALDFEEYFGSIYCRPFEGNYFLFNYALRSSIFGEFSYWQGEGFAVAAIFFAYAAVVCLAISLTWAVVICIRKRKLGLPLPELLFLFLLLQSQVLSEVYFYAKMPYGCTMDFRYIMPMILGIALTLGWTQEVLQAEGGRFSLTANKLTRYATAAFLGVSVLFYCVCI